MYATGHAGRSCLARWKTGWLNRQDGCAARVALPPAMSQPRRQFYQRLAHPFIHRRQCGGNVSWILLLAVPDQLECEHPGGLLQHLHRRQQPAAAPCQAQCRCEGEASSAYKPCMPWRTAQAEPPREHCRSAHMWEPHINQECRSSQTRSHAFITCLTNRSQQQTNRAAGKPHIVKA